jgi:hypothetical protein
MPNCKPMRTSPPLVDNINLWLPAVDIPIGAHAPTVPLYRELLSGMGRLFNGLTNDENRTLAVGPLIIGRLRESTIQWVAPCAPDGQH